MDPLITASLAGGLVQGFGSLIGTKYGADRGQAAADQAWDRESTFAREMANTAHVRQVQDLRAAGLNPILSGLGGSGAGGQASARAADVPDFGAAGGSMGNSVMNVANFANQLRATDSTIRLQEQEAKKVDADAALARTQAALNLLNQDNIPTAKKKMLSEIAINDQLARLRRAEASSAEAAVPGDVLTGKLQGSPGYRSLEVGGKVAMGVLHALTLGLAFKGLAGAQRPAPRIQQYDNSHLPPNFAR